MLRKTFQIIDLREIYIDVCGEGEEEGLKIKTINPLRSISKNTQVRDQTIYFIIFTTHKHVYARCPHPQPTLSFSFCLWGTTRGLITLRHALNPWCW